MGRTTVTLRKTLHIPEKGKVKSMEARAMTPVR